MDAQNRFLIEVAHNRTHALAIGERTIAGLAGGHASRRTSFANEFCWMACSAGEDGGSIHDAAEIAEFPFLVNYIPRLRHALGADRLCILRSCSAGEISSLTEAAGRKLHSILEELRGRAPFRPAAQDRFLLLNHRAIAVRHRPECFGRRDRLHQLVEIPRRFGLRRRLHLEQIHVVNMPAVRSHRPLTEQRIL